MVYTQNNLPITQAWYVVCDKDSLKPLSDPDHKK